VKKTLLFVMCTNLLAYDSPSTGNLQIFPADNYWRWNISQHDVHPNSNNFISSVGIDKNLHPDFGTVWAGAPNGIPYEVVGNSDAMVPVTFTAWGNESDPGPYRIPLTAQIEGGASSTGDRHVIGVDTSNKILYELYSSYPKATNWEAASGAIFDLTKNDFHPDTWTSADAAGLPIFPGLVRYEEAAALGEINHAIRVTVNNSQKACIFPASHYASSSTDPNRPPMGLRFRLKADYDISTFPAVAQVILRALKKHGMIVADNGGDWFISGAPDTRWSDDDLHTLKQVKGSDFEVVRTVDDNGDPIYPSSTRSARSKLLMQRAEKSAAGCNFFDMQGRRMQAAAASVHPGVYLLMPAGRTPVKRFNVSQNRALTEN
jgi:hypothetical protein